jgi:uncharacterized alpha-E superfamily protein
MGAGVMMPLMDPMPNMLLSRYAESMVWLARYMERIENLARLIEVTEVFVRLRSATNGWQCIIDINCDDEVFRSQYDRVTAETIIRFYVLNRENPNSIWCLASAARENARALRPLISTEMWTQLNVFTNFILSLRADDIPLARLSQLCTRIKQDCQTHTGVTEGTLYRDQAWLFYAIGKQIERGDQTTRLIDIKYHALLPTAEGIGSETDLSQWTAVLRSAAGYHAFRRLMPTRMDPAGVAGFLLMNEAFPRSLATALRHIHHALGLLRTDHGLRRAAPIIERVEHLRALLSGQTMEEIIIRGLHEFLDGMQGELATVQSLVADAFWRT